MKGKLTIWRMGCIIQRGKRLTLLTGACMRTVGIYYAYWTRDWDDDAAPYIEKAKTLGFDLLELNGGSIADMGTAQRRNLRSIARDQGIALSYGIGLKKQYDVSSLDEDVRNRGTAYMKKMILAVEEMGGGMIGGTVHGYWPAAMPEGTDDKRPYWDQSIRSMKKLAAFAEDHGVVLNVEVINRFEQFLINDSYEALAYVEEVGSPACRVLLDTFHMNIEEDSFGDAVRRIGPYLSALHLGETNRKLPGTGRIPWDEIRTALDDIHFDGPLVMEPFVMKGGQVGRDIGIWRDMLENPDLDALAADAAVFVKTRLIN